LPKTYFGPNVGVNFDTTFSMDEHKRVNVTVSFYV
jgi:hypothetical protein